jgi:hypothetical protein
MSPDVNQKTSAVIRQEQRGLCPAAQWQGGGWPIYRLDAVRAHLLEMAGDEQAALAHYRAAASRTTSLPEQRYLATQAARLNQRST